MRRGKAILAVSVVVMLSLGYVSHLSTQPSFNDPGAGCGGGGCHTSTAGILTVTTNNLKVTIKLTGTTGNVAGELVNGAGTVVAFNDKSSANPFDLTAPSAGVYTVNAGFKSPSRQWESKSVTVGPVPIQLSSFTGAVVSANTVRLDWETLSETNNYGFTVERRIAGDAAFVELPSSFVAGQGTTTIPHKYTYTDNSTTTGVWYYRLKQTDLDGTIHRSDAIQISALTGVTEQAPLQFSLLQNYPNPFNPSTTITYRIASPAFVSLEVLDITGNRVASLVNEQKVQGEYTLNFDARDLASGVYFYRLKASTTDQGSPALAGQAGTFVATRKLLLVR